MFCLGALYTTSLASQTLSPREGLACETIDPHQVYSWYIKHRVNQCLQQCDIATTRFGGGQPLSSTAVSSSSLPTHVPVEHEEACRGSGLQATRGLCLGCVCASGFQT